MPPKKNCAPRTDVTVDSQTAPQAKKRKAATKEADAPVKKRGRTAKAAAAATKDDADKPDVPVEDAPTTTKTRGRPATKDAANAKSAVTSEEKASPRKRGRPPKAGETAKSHADQEAAKKTL
ncbi:hypothetical protein LTR32_004360 [Rachicladosporium monterosium]|uniref:Histone H1 n=1 Tax=Rachicladosporium monterosium TaxID=1507873 RepID=A0ABR0L4Y5_9PEZI|nr:hypothetical protein LTR32_004360 [Rachicladosporium monterosium]